jgi:hypothetical protein
VAAVRGHRNTTANTTAAATLHLRVVISMAGEAEIAAAEMEEDIDADPSV